MTDLDPDARLFLGDPNRDTQPFLTRYWLPVGGALIFGIGSIVGNLATRKPPLSGAQIHLLLMGGGGLFGEWGYRKKEEWSAERDAQYYHYITLHPEDFPPPKRILYRDYLTPWVPHR